MATAAQPSFVDRWGAPLLSSLVLVAVLALLFVARGSDEASPRFQVDPTLVEVTHHPSWMPAAAAWDLAEVLGTSLGEPASLLGDEDLRSWRGDLLDASAWVASVDHVEARFPGRAEVRLRLRRPVLVLPGDLLLSGDGHHLGRGFVDVDPLPLRFEGFGDVADVRECAASAAEILPYREDLAAEGVVFDRVLMGDRSRVRFLTPAGVEVEWGRSANRSEFAAVDLPPLARIGHLLSVVDRRPGLHGVSRVVVWKDQPEVLLEAPDDP